MKYYVQPGRNFDRLARSETVPPGRVEVTDRADAEGYFRVQLSWEIGSGYLDPDTDTEATVAAFLAQFDRDQAV